MTNVLLIKQLKQSALRCFPSIEKPSPHSAAQFTISLNQHYTLIDMDLNAQKNLEWDAEQTLGQNYFQLIHEHQYNSFSKKALKDSINRGGGQLGHLEFTDIRGRNCAFNVSLNCYGDILRLTFHQIACRDTPSLEESYQLFKKNISLHYDFFFIKCTNFMYFDANEAFSYASGIRTDSVISGKSDYQLAWGESISNIYRNGDIETINTPFLARTYIQYRVEPININNPLSQQVIGSKQPLFDEEQQLIGILGTFNRIQSPKIQTLNELNPDHLNAIHKKLALRSTKNQEAVLNPKEQKILLMLLQGYATKEIARDLELSTKTVFNYIQNIVNRFYFTTRKQLLDEARRSNWMTVIYNSFNS